MLAQSRGLHRILLPRNHRILSTSFRNHVVSLNLPQRSSSTSAMAHPPHSSADSIRIPPLESEHVDSVVSTVNKTEKQPKDKKNSKVAPTASGYPLEVRASGCRYSVSLSHFFHSVATTSGIFRPPPEDLYWTQGRTRCLGCRCSYSVYLPRILSPLNIRHILAQPREEIIIAMPDGSERKGKSWETSPMDIAKEVSKSLSERIVIAKVWHGWRW